MKQKVTININETDPFVGFEYSFLKYGNIRETKNINDHLELRFNEETEELTFISKMKGKNIKNNSANLGGSAYIYPASMTYEEYVKVTPKTYNIFYRGTPGGADHEQNTQEAIQETIELYTTSMKYAEALFAGTFIHNSVTYTVEVPLFED